jgi:hypothetical protein
MNRTFPFSLWRCVLLTALVVTLGLILSGAAKERKISALKLKRESAAVVRQSEHSIPRRNDKPAGEFRRLHDSALTGGGFLISKVHSESEAGEDLWFQNAEGGERFIANDVVHARFSPDGNRIAYSTSDYEVFIETLSGERLVEIPHASDPTWRADSATVSFVAIPSADYPELQQLAVYDLKSGEVSESGNNTDNRNHDASNVTLSPQTPPILNLQNQNRKYEKK